MGGGFRYGVQPQHEMRRTSDPTKAEKFNTYRFADNNWP